MDARHTPTPDQLRLLRMDLGESRIATVRCRNGYPQDCLRSSGEEMSLVLVPSLAFTQEKRGDIRLNVVGFDHALSIEFNRGSTQEICWVRDPNGLWLRWTDTGR
jgi:hypothetical protein